MEVFIMLIDYSAENLNNENLIDLEQNMEQTLSNVGRVDTEELNKQLKGIEKGKNTQLSIHIGFPHNAIPSSEMGDCQTLLVGYIMDKKDFSERMPLILQSLLTCKKKNEAVIFIVNYWDGAEWEKKWKKSFKLVSSKTKVFRKFLDSHGRPERII